LSLKKQMAKDNLKVRLEDLRMEARLLADPEKAKISAGFFKTGKGDYGEGDKFIGLTMPDIRRLALKYATLDISGIKKLARSAIHEERMTALVIMTLRYPREKEKFYRLYMKSRAHINNWDLVDVTCPKIVGDYLLDKPRGLLYEMARSENLWERRMAIVATFEFIKNNDFSDTFKIAEILLGDNHDLIHKAVGWMLREAGKRDKRAEEDFLRKHCRSMPRTMLRYAIEKFPENERRRYLKK